MKYTKDEFEKFLLKYRYHLCDLVAGELSIMDLMEKIWAGRTHRLTLYSDKTMFFMLYGCPMTFYYGAEGGTANNRTHFFCYLSALVEDTKPSEEEEVIDPIINLMAWHGSLNDVSKDFIIKTAFHEEMFPDNDILSDDEVLELLIKAGLRYDR